MKNEMSHKDALRLVQRLIQEIHGVRLSLEQIGKRWRDIREGVPLEALLPIQIGK